MFVRVLNYWQILKLYFHPGNFNLNFRLTLETRRKLKFNSETFKIITFPVLFFNVLSIRVFHFLVTVSKQNLFSFIGCDSERLKFRNYYFKLFQNCEPCHLQFRGCSICYLMLVWLYYMSTFSHQLCCILLVDFVMSPRSIYGESAMETFLY